MNPNKNVISFGGDFDGTIDFEKIDGMEKLALSQAVDSKGRAPSGQDVDSE